MLQQITKGIRVTVASRYHGTVFHNKITRHAFAYHIAIENQGKNAVQLLTRHWKVQEALDPNSIVSGEGIVGKKPVLQPGETHTYSSICYLCSPVGLMKGIFMMINLSTTEKFEVPVPPIQLSAPFILN